MSWITEFTNRIQAAWRAFVLGSAIVQPYEMAWGHQSEQRAPDATTHDYLVRSNGVYACSTLRAELLASLPLRLYRGAGDARKEVTSGALFDLLSTVNPFWTFNRLISMTELSLCRWGESFWFMERGENGNGKPREIWWARPDRVDIIPDPVNYIGGFIYKPVTGGQVLHFAPSETLWLRFPNPLDEFEGLAPLMAAQMSADYGMQSLRSSTSLHENGINGGGLLMPKAGAQFSKEQAEELQEKLARRFKGVDNAHRWGVLRFEAQAQPFGFNPREAQFVEGQKMALEDIARVYKVPLDLIGGQRTYENVNAAMLAIWTMCVLPEAAFIATELVEQLLPLFGDADTCEFDASGVAVLQMAERENWTREKEQIERGVLTVNEWRQAHGKDALAWGDVWWAPSHIVPIDSPTMPTPPQPAMPAPVAALAATTASVSADNVWNTNDTKEHDPSTSSGYEKREMVAYGSDEHARLWGRFAQRTQAHEARFGKLVGELLRRQRESILSKLRARNQRDGDDIADEPFDMAEWIKRFRVEARPEIQRIVGEDGAAALEDYSIGIAFDVLEPQVLRFIEQRAQRFAREVNQTTWNDLKASLSDGLDEGESIEQLSERVNEIMGARIQSSAETIARTEVVGASNGGTLLAWEQSGVVERKVWLATFDARTRESHAEAHGQERDIDEDFEVGGASGPAPGQLGDAAEDINCRCTMTAKIGTRTTRKSAKGAKEEHETRERGTVYA